MSNKRILQLLLLVQGICMFIAFHKYFAHPTNFMFNNVGDGLKNYFTLFSYIRPENKSFLMMDYLNFPFGDYIFYTDNTPLFSLPIKLFSTYIFDITPYSIGIFNGICIFAMLLSTLLLYKILSRFLTQKWLIFVFSICLVWINPQTIRMERGHLNLGLSFILLLCIWLIIRYLDHRKSNPVKGFMTGIMLVFTIIGASFIHLYYGAILAVFVSSVFAAYGISSIKFPLTTIKRMATGIGISLFALLIVLGSIKLIDQYYEFRKSVPEGYDYSEWKLRLSSLFYAHPFQSIKIPFSPEYLPVESRNYLGAFNLLSVLIIGGILAFRKNITLSLRHIFGKHRPDSRILLYILFGGFICLMISLGEKITLFGTPNIPNLLNPFFYLAYVAESFKQFRCLGRFGWFFFWGFSFITLYILDYCWQHSHKHIIHFGIILVAFLAVADTVDFIRFQNSKHHGDLLSNEQNMTDAIKLSEEITLKKYQAILPLPYFHVGSENYNYTIDVEEDFFTFCTQFSAITGLPLMGNRMSRTAENQTKELFSLFLDPEMHPHLRGLLDNRHILILSNKKLIEDSSWYRNGELQPARTVGLNGQEILKKKGIKKFAEHGDYELYFWRIGLDKNVFTFD